MKSPFNSPQSQDSQDSPHHHHQHPANTRNRRTDGWVRGHRMLVWAAALLLIVATAAVSYAHSHWRSASERPSRLTVESGPGTPSQPADQYMRSIINEDGALGWHQLCPSLQAQLSINALVQVAQAQRTALAQYGVWLSLKFMGIQPQRDGGVSHVYIVTAHWPGGTTQTLTYTVLTQPSGCVDDVQKHG